MMVRPAFLLAAVAALSLVSPPAAGQPSATPERVRMAVSGAVSSVALERRIGVDPATVERMVAGAVIFAGSFCLAESQQNQAVADGRCNKTLYSEAVLRRHVRGFLADAESKVATLVPLGARLAGEIGADFSQIGWPTHETNSVGTVVLPSKQGLARVTLVAATEGIPIAQRANRVLLDGGQHLLLVRFENGSELSGPVTVVPRRQVAFAGSAEAGAISTIRRLDAPSASFCYERAAFKPNEPLTFFNWGRRQFAESSDQRDQYLAPFVRQYAVDISIEDMTATCNSKCKQAIGVIFAESVAVWRTGCARCDANALAFLRVDSFVWMDTRLASRLRLREAGTVVPLDLRDRRAEEMSRSVSAPSLSIPQMQLSATSRLHPIQSYADPSAS